MNRIRVTALIAALGIALCVGSMPATAVESSTHPRIASALAALPGGIATGDTTAEWPDLGITFTVATEHARAVGTCATGLVCAYRSAGLSGDRTTFSGCATWSTTPFGTVGSIANARTSGWADARNSAGTTLRSIGYGTWADVPLGTTSIACGGSGITL